MPLNSGAVKVMLLLVATAFNNTLSFMDAVCAYPVVAVKVLAVRSHAEYHPSLSVRGPEAWRERVRWLGMEAGARMLVKIHSTRRMSEYRYISGFILLRTHVGGVWPLRGTVYSYQPILWPCTLIRLFYAVVG